MHRVPLEKGSLDFFAKLKPSDNLVVTLVGAAAPSRNFYPKFQRVSTFRGAVNSLLAFSDPTLSLRISEDILLAWYLGWPGFDPTDAIVRTINRAQGKTGARRVILVAGSGGGFPALRISAKIPGSLAVIHAGATNIARSRPRSVARYFEAYWPGWNKDQLIEAFPERFNMVDYYSQNVFPNFVYFTQTTDDVYFLENHFLPFKEANGVPGSRETNGVGSRVFKTYKGEKPGHGNITQEEFWQNFNEAIGLYENWWNGRYGKGGMA